MKEIFFILLFFCATANTNAQEYFKEGKNRLNFAKTYVELGGRYSPTFTGKTANGNSVQNFNNSASIAPYLNIGALHFWGHADFYISIPLAQAYINEKDSSNFQLNQSVVTGARFLPWAYQDKKIRPFIGVSWAVANFKQNNNQPMHSKNKLLFDAGLLYGKASLMTRLGVNFYPTNKWDYPITPTNYQEIKTPGWSASVGLIYSFESTRSKNREKDNARLNEFPLVSKPTMHAMKKGDYFIGIGPSTSFMLSKSDYNESYFSYFNKRPISNSYLDISFGYQFNKSGVITALSLRNPEFINEAYGVTQTIKKNSMTVEVYKFLTDYSGFTPYLGLNLAYDNIDYSEKTNATEYRKSFRHVNPGITFGWDILPGKTEQFFVLRTNLRWYPFSKISINGKSFSQNQLEYNVIQAVFYPSRFKSAKSKRDN